MRKLKDLPAYFKKNKFPEGLLNKVMNRYFEQVSKSTALSVDPKPLDGIFNPLF